MNNTELSSHPIILLVVICASCVIGILLAVLLLGFIKKLINGKLAKIDEEVRGQFVFISMTDTAVLSCRWHIEYEIPPMRAIISEDTVFRYTEGEIREQITRHYPTWIIRKLESILT